MNEQLSWVYENNDESTRDESSIDESSREESNDHEFMELLAECSLKPENLMDLPFWCLPNIFHFLSLNDMKSLEIVSKTMKSILNNVDMEFSYVKNRKKEKKFMLFNECSLFFRNFEAEEARKQKQLLIKTIKLYPLKVVPVLKGVADCTIDMIDGTVGQDMDPLRTGKTICGISFLICLTCCAIAEFCNASKHSLQGLGLGVLFTGFAIAACYVPFAIFYMLTQPIFDLIRRSQIDRVHEVINQETNDIVTLWEERRQTPSVRAMNWGN